MRNLQILIASPPGREKFYEEVTSRIVEHEAVLREKADRELAAAVAKAKNTVRERGNFLDAESAVNADDLTTAEKTVRDRNLDSTKRWRGVRTLADKNVPPSAAREAEEKILLEARTALTTYVHAYQW